MKLKILKEVLLENIDFFLAYFFIPILIVAKHFFLLNELITTYPILVAIILITEIVLRENKPNYFLELIKLIYKLLCYISIVFAFNHYEGEKVLFFVASILSLLLTIIFSIYYLIKKEHGTNALQAYFYFSVYLFTIYYFGGIKFFF